MPRLASHLWARRIPRLLAAALLLNAGAACARGSSASAEGTPRRDAKMVTESELAVATQLNLYDYVAAERPRWLRTASMSTFPVIVFVEDSRLGGIQTLKTLTTGTVRMLRYYEASAAQQKFAGRDIGPVIQVFMR